MFTHCENYYLCCSQFWNLQLNFVSLTGRNISDIMCCISTAPYITEMITLGTRQNEFHFAHGICKHIFLNWYLRMSSKLHWRLLSSVQLTISPIGSDNGLAPNWRQAVIWTKDDLVHRRIYTLLGLDKLCSRFTLWRARTGRFDPLP